MVKTTDSQADNPVNTPNGERKMRERNQEREQALRDIEQHLRKPGHKYAAFAVLRRYFDGLERRNEDQGEHWVAALELSERTANLLERHGIRQISELQEAIGGELFELDGFGPRVVGEVVMALHRWERRARESAAKIDL